MKTTFMICVLAFSFMLGKTKDKPKSIQTTYYWFDTNLNYLRSNNIDDEATITGYNNNTANPKTLQELGFTPSHCTGWPPAPIDSDAPDQRFYSHP